MYLIIFFAWYTLMIVQMFMGYGSAYRLTKRGGDNGIALCGWMFVMEMAAAIPGLGIYLWKKYKEEPMDNYSQNNNNNGQYYNNNDNNNNYNG